MSTVTKEQITEALKTVIDPEIHADVYTLGLIYDIKTGDDGIDILMTLTTPFCPYGDEIDSGVDVDALKKVFGVIEHLRANGVGFLLVSHHPNLLKHVTPDHVHVMREGKIVASGGKELIEKISRDGFDNI